MKSFQTVEIKLTPPSGIIWLNRPEVHNAFNDVMIREIMEALEALNSNSQVRIIQIRGRGKSFSSGADLNWLGDVSRFTYEENLKDSLALAECFYRIYASPKPVISVAHGAAIGGALGLLVAADFAVCTLDTQLSLSEVKIGVVPACIAPYILKRTGEYRSKELMLTGRRISGTEAEAYGLVNRAVASEDLDHVIHSWITELKTSGPEAMREVKSLIENITGMASFEGARLETARIIARIRASEEAQEGMHAFLEKRVPNWRRENR